MKFNTFPNEFEQIKPSQKDHSMFKRTSVYSIILIVKMPFGKAKTNNKFVMRSQGLLYIQLTILLIQYKTSSLLNQICFIIQHNHDECESFLFTILCTFNLII